MPEKKEILHAGVLGMRWGIRKSDSKGGSSDHNNAAAIKRKPLKNMTDTEVKTATSRMLLVSQYKKVRSPITNLQSILKNKKVSTMSNEDLAKGILREKLLKEDWKTGVRKPKPIRSMTDVEVKATLDRHLLEKPYRKLLTEEYAPALKVTKKILDILLRVIRVTSASQARSDYQDAVNDTGIYALPERIYALPERTS